jgi:hypothetical protein
MASLVQVAYGSGDATTITATFGANITAGNTLVAFLVNNNESGFSTTSLETGSNAEHWTQETTYGNTGAIYADVDTSGGVTTVSVKLSGTSQPIDFAVAEITGVLASSAVDKFTGQLGSSGGTWSSTATGTTTQASEIFVGCVIQFGSTTITGPTSTWANQAQASFSSSGNCGMLGVDIVGSTGTATYSGTATGSNNYVAGVITLKSLAGVVGASHVISQAVQRAASY